MGSVPTGSERFGPMLRAYRLQALQSQEDLAGRCGLSVRTIGGLEQGRVRSPRVGSVRLLADALELSAEERRQFLAAARPEEPAPTTPRQLPPDVTDFTGRTAEIKTVIGRIEEVVLDAVPVVAVAGAAGVGKTALAVHVAHLLRDRFPDGQLFANLGGVELPGTATAVLGRFLRALGVEAVPDAEEEQQGLYRSLLADRRLLVVLDNAATEAQVRPLLPGTAGCAVLVTSRRRLLGLEGAELVDAGVLAGDDGIALLASVLGRERVAAEPEEAAAIVGFCGGLPLAVRIAAARLRGSPEWPLARLGTELADERGRLDALTAGDLEVRAGLATGYRALAVEQRRALRLLALLPVDDFPSWLAAPLLGLPLGPAERLVEGLAAAQLLDPAGDRRHRFHDLVRLYARERAEAEEPAADRQAALERVTAGWNGMAAAADRLLPVPSKARDVATADRWPVPPELVERLLGDPYGWIELEHTNLLAAARVAAEAGLVAASWEIASRLVALLSRRGDMVSWLATRDAAVASCGEAWQLTVLAAAARRTGPGR